MQPAVEGVALNTVDGCAARVQLVGEAVPAEVSRARLGPVQMEAGQAVHKGCVG